MSKRLLRWFGNYRNETVLKMVNEHLEMTESAVKALYEMVCTACEGPKDKVGLYNTISEYEMKADNLRRDMIVRLTERSIYAEERQDLMDLVRAVDWVADWSREAGRILVIIPFESAPDLMKQSAENMCKACVSCVSLLADCINVLQKEDRMKAIELANEVELLEEDIDDLYGIARKHLSTLKYPEFTVGDLILLNEFLDAIESVADWCENTVDIVRAIAVRI